VNGGSVRRATILHDATYWSVARELARRASPFGDVGRRLRRSSRANSALPNLAPDAAAFGSHAYATFDRASIGYNELARV
jgi:hypothetical protein